MRKLAHLVNPVIVGEGSDLFAAQPITFETMRRAKDLARSEVDVTLLTAQYPEDRPLVAPWFRPTPDLERSVLDEGTFHQRRKLPLLADLLDRLHGASDAEYLIYTNVDIALMPHFYLMVHRLITAGHDAFVINRRTISTTRHRVEDIPFMYGEVGERHEGHDCFVFSRAAYPKYKLGKVCIGIPWVGRVLLWNVICQAERFRELTDEHLTFHLGSDRAWEGTTSSDYCAHNRSEASKVLLALEAERGRFSEDVVLSRYPLEVLGGKPGRPGFLARVAGRVRRRRP